MRDLNIYHTTTGQLNLSPRIKKAKRGKGSFSRKAKHKAKQFSNH
jgi:stalled ribosome alternative rescue factor ArfA